MVLAARLKRLERTRGARGCGPGCPPRGLALYRQDGPHGERVRDAGQQPPAPCPRCGRPAEVLEMVLIYDPDLYGNAERLGELTT